MAVSSILTGFREDDPSPPSPSRTRVPNCVDWIYVDLHRRTEQVNMVYEAILVPTDGSDCARDALDHAVDIATRHDATVHVISVVDEWNLERIQLEQDTRLQRARELVDDVVDTIDADVPVETSVEVGVIHETILAYATGQEIDLVVMGTHGRTGVERYLLGSVAEKVIRTSPIPVLTVRSARDD